MLALYTRSNASPEERDRARSRKSTDGVDHHPREHHAGQLEPGRLDDDPHRDEAGHDVAEERHEPDDRVEADPAPGPGHRDQVVEHVGDVADPPLRREDALGPPAVVRVGVGAGSGSGARAGTGAGGAHPRIMRPGHGTRPCPGATRLAGARPLPRRVRPRARRGAGRFEPCCTAPIPGSTSSPAACRRARPTSCSASSAAPRSPSGGSCSSAPTSTTGRPASTRRAGAKARFPSILVSKGEPVGILSLARERDVDLVGIEEAQFFDASLAGVADTLRQSGRHVIASGLNTDFAGRPFGAMPMLLALADQITMLTAICVVCGETATRTQRLVGGRPAAIDDPLIVIGGFDGRAVETYEARCLAAPRGRRRPGSPAGSSPRRRSPDAAPRPQVVHDAARNRGQLPRHRPETRGQPCWRLPRAPADIVRFARRGRWHRRRTDQ